MQGKKNPMEILEFNGSDYNTVRKLLFAEGYRETQYSLDERNGEETATFRMGADRIAYTHRFRKRLGATETLEKTWWLYRNSAR